MAINNQLNSANSPFYLIKSVTLTNTQFNGIYATPFEIIAAPAAGNMHIILHWAMMYVYGGTNAFTNGGTVILQWGTAANGAGQGTCNTMASTNFTGFAKSYSRQLPIAASAVAKASFDGLSICLSNQTQAFATGTGNSIICNVGYVTVPTGL